MSNTLTMSNILTRETLESTALAYKHQAAHKPSIVAQNGEATYVADYVDNYLGMLRQMPGADSNELVAKATAQLPDLDRRIASRGTMTDLLGWATLAGVVAGIGGIVMASGPLAAAGLVGIFGGVVSLVIAEPSELRSKATTLRSFIDQTQQLQTYVSQTSVSPAVAGANAQPSAAIAVV